MSPTLQDSVGANVAHPDADVVIIEGVTDYQDPARIDAMVAQALNALPEAFGMIQPGQRVVLKPNWVKEHNTRKPQPDTWMPVITHPEVIFSVARWVASQLQGRGTIILCDAPQSDSSFDRIREYCGLDARLEECRRQFPGVVFEMFDLRREEWSTLDGITVARRDLPADPAGSVNVSLDEQSEFYQYRGLGRLYGAAYDFEETNRQHRDPVHHYLLCRTPLTADVLINIPKLKTHKKVGLTVALKNMVGITARTNWLPRHTEGTPDQGGDQFQDSRVRHKLEHVLMRKAKSILKGNYFLSRLFVPLKAIGRWFFGDTEHVVRSGNWHGNDTCWRMILDLHKCIFHFDADGKPRSQPPKQLIVVDGIIAGEGDGPMAPDEKVCGVLIAGTHPLAVDCAAASLMGFDWRKLKLLSRAFGLTKLPIAKFKPEDIRIISNHASWQGSVDALEESFKFRPHFGWKGKIEKLP